MAERTRASRTINHGECPEFLRGMHVALAGRGHEQL